MSALQEPPYDEVSSGPPSSPAGASAGGGKLVPFLLADIGEGIAEVELMQWFVQEGENVKQFDRVCEVQSDKATVEISSRYDGVVRRVLHPVGSVVKVGSALIDIEVGGQENSSSTATLATAPTMNNADVPSPAEAAEAALVSSPPLGGSEPLPVQAQASHSSTADLKKGPETTYNSRDMTGEIVPTTPAVRRLAKEHGVDLSLVRPTGPEGRVLKGDVLDFIAAHQGHVGLPPSFFPASPLPPGVPASATGTRPVPGEAASPAASPPSPVPPHPLGSSSFLKPAVLPPFSAAALTEPKRVPVRGIMRQMVKSMNASLKIPHFGYQDEVCMDKAAGLRASLRPFAEAQGFKLTYLPIMLKAASLALLRYPLLNASLSADEREIIYHPDHHIGVAMATSKGLVVPVLRKVQERSLLEIAGELADFQRKAEGGDQGGGGFKEEDFQGATFSMSNIGSMGGTYMDAKIVPPQVAIGAIGRIQTLPRFGPARTVEGSQVSSEKGLVVLPTKVMAISWAGDHRVVDGATMAKFSNLWKSYLEEPATMLAETR